MQAESPGPESVRPGSDAGSAASQLSDLCMPLGPSLLSGDISVVKGLCPQAWHIVGPMSIRYCYRQWEQ